MSRWPRRLAQRMAAGGRRPAQQLPPATPTDGGLLEAFSEPLLLLQGTLVTDANRAARALLGAYIEGEDVRLAIRHPDAAGPLSAGNGGPVAIGGLGNPEQRWELNIAHLADGRSLVRLEDRSAHAAAERMRTDFVANASHELRTPLAALIGFIETLEDANGPDDGAVRQRFLGIMAREARRMQRLVDDLISLSRVEADRFVAPRQRTDLVQLVRIAAAEISAGGNTDGRLRLQLPDTAATVIADPPQISQLLHNVIGNALKYGRTGGAVRIGLSIDGGRARLAVEDEGEGIAAEHIPRLTERFYRVDPGRSRGLGGTGLGLSIVKHIVERHRGRLEIRSTQGIGTAVLVTLPLAPDTLS